MRYRHRLVALAVLPAIALAGCGGDGDSTDTTVAAPAGVDDAEATPSTDAEPTGATSGPGVYEWRSDTGAVIRYTIPAANEQETVAAIRQLKADAGVGGDVSFVVAELDNTGGTEETLLYPPEVVTDDGSTVRFDNAWLLVGDWQNGIDINAQTDLYDRATDLYNSMLNQDSALPGAKTTAILAAEGPLPSIQSVYISPGTQGAVQLEQAG